MPRSRKNGPSDLAALATRKLIDSRRLLYFFHVARSGRFTTAEASLDVAQSAISRQIQQLEADLGVQLLERTGHGVRLTGPGEILYKQAESILKEMAVTLDMIELAQRAPSSRVTIAAPPSFMASYMPEIVERFAISHPDTSISAIEASTGNVYDHLANSQVDLAIVLYAPNNAKIRLQKLLVEPLLLIASPKHPIARHPVVQRSELEMLDLVVPASLLGSREILRQYLEAGGLSLTARLEADSLPLTKVLVQSGRSCTILPKITCELELNSGKLVGIPLQPELTRTLYIARLRDRLQSAEAKGLVREIVTVVNHKIAARN